MLVVPLIVGDSLIGWFSVRNTAPQDYRPDQLDLAAALAQQAALAVQLTRLGAQGRQAAVLEERNRMAREIHDTLAQGFTGILMQLEATESALETARPDLAHERLAKARDLARASLSEARRSVWALRPQALDQQPFVAALRAAATTLTDAVAIQLSFAVEGTVGYITTELETDLLRVAQEAITNSVKHAAVHNLIVRLHDDGKQLELHIRDDGRGFEAQAARKLDGSGFGLTAMRERMERHGGHLSVFFTLAFSITWAFLIADALGARGLISFRLTLSGPGLALTLLMSYGPTIAALIVAGVTEGRAGIKVLLGSVVRWRVGLLWYIVGLGGPAALFFVAGRVSELLGGAPHPLPVGGWNLLLLGIAGSLVHGIANGEEIGWRGYALPRLLERHSPLVASLILGVIWAAFHIPIMFVAGGVAGNQSFDSVLPFVVGTVALSILITWIYRHTGGSVLIIILLHGALNTWPGLLGDGGVTAFALQVLAAVGVVIYGRADLSRKPPHHAAPASECH